MREQISLMLQKNTITGVPPDDSRGFYWNLFLVRKILCILALSSCRKIRDLLRLMTPGTFQQSLLASQSLVLLTAQYTIRALRYYHRYMKEHPELRKGRRWLFVPIKDNNARQEFSAATSSRWICTTIVDSHAALQNSKSTVSQDHQSSRGPCSGYFIAAHQQGSPSSSDEGRKMVQRTSLL